MLVFGYLDKNYRNFTEKYDSYCFVKIFFVKSPQSINILHMVYIKMKTNQIDWRIKI